MKKELEDTNGLYPSLTALVGTVVDGNVNFLTIAHVGIIGMKLLSVSLSKSHYSNAGIRQNKTFSVNIPCVDQVRETDYCGLVSGKKVEKASVFTVFYGKLETAPMIQNCPLTMECRLAKTVDFPTHEVFIGEIAGTYCDEEILTRGKIDVGKLRPLLFVMHDASYWTVGQPYTKAWSIGKQRGKHDD